MSDVSKTIATKTIATKTIASWRTPVLVIGFGSLIALIAFGPRSTLGFFLTPLSSANHWGRDVFASASRSAGSSPIGSVACGCCAAARCSTRLVSY